MLIVLCFLGTFYCYWSVRSLVFPEMAYFYNMYGNSPRPTLHQVISAYNILQPGWYRPTSFFLFPFLLGLNYFNPAGVVFWNLVFFGLTGSLVPTLFLPRSDLPTRLLASCLILTAPALVAVSYFPTIDSLYILFSLLFVRSFERMVTGDRKGKRSAAFLSIFWYLAALTSKETSILLPVIAFLYTIINASDRHPQCSQLFRKAMVHCLPFVGLSGVYYVLYLVARGAYANAVYADIPTINKLPNILKLLYATLNVHLPIFPGKDVPTAGYPLMGNMIWSAIWLLTAGGLWWRWETIPVVKKMGFLFILTFLYLLSGMAGGHFHHVFPMMVCWAILIGRLFSFPGEILRWQRWKWGIELAVIAGLLFSCRTYASEILAVGEHGRVLQINTALFADHQLAALAHRDDCYLLVESDPWDLGGTVGVLGYLGRSSHTEARREEYVATITPETIRHVAARHPHKVIFGLFVRAEDHTYSIRRLWPLPH